MSSSQSSPAEAAVARLERDVDALLSLVASAPRAALYETSGEDWSVMRVAAHVAELLPYWADQAAAVAGRTEDGAPFGRTHDDPDRVAAVEEHADDEREVAAERVRAALAGAVATLRAIPVAGWSRTARHARRGEMSVERIVDAFLVTHLEEHRRQAEAALASAAAS